MSPRGIPTHRRAKYSLNHAASLMTLPALLNSCNTACNKFSTLKLREFEPAAPDPISPRTQITEGAWGKESGGAGMTTRQLLHPEFPAQMREQEMNHECVAVRIEIVQLLGVSGSEREVSAGALQRAYLVVGMGHVACAWHHHVCHACLLSATHMNTLTRVRHWCRLVRRHEVVWLVEAGVRGRASPRV